MGLVELYRTTRDPKHLELAGVFVDMRGSARGGTDVNQTRIPLRKEIEAVGHAVTACYLYAGAADVYAETDEPALWEALERIWKNVATEKLYVTGAVGALNQGASSRRDLVHEAFGFSYDLPGRAAYNETCANIANAMWNWRMLSVTGEARYADLMELVLYNSMLSGIALDGKAFFYSNPLVSFGGEVPVMRNQSLERWGDTTAPGASRSYCCPPSVARTLANLHGWAYSVSPGAVWVNLYGGNTLAVEGVRLTQETDYPWEGNIRFRIEQAPEDELALQLRIPAWAQGASIRVNGRPGPAAPAGQYAEVRRRWSRGDRLELDLPLAPRLLESNPLTEQTRNHVAVARGPLVYCLESPDLPPGVRFTEVALPAGIRLSARFDRQLLGGVVVLEGEARRIPEAQWKGLLYRTLRPTPPEPVRIRLIPYYAWANRGLSQMTVWLPRG